MNKAPSDIALPRYSLSGTPRANLMEVLLSALNALREAREKLEAAHPNARDYTSPQEFASACENHRSRAERLESVMRELEAITDHVASFPER